MRDFLFIELSACVEVLFKSVLYHLTSLICFQICVPNEPHCHASTSSNDEALEEMVDDPGYPTTPNESHHSDSGPSYVEALEEMVDDPGYPNNVSYHSFK